MGSYTYEKDFVKVGRWGGGGGRHWDDGVQGSVREIVISYGSGIDSIKFQYEKDGKLFWSKKHGGKGGDHTKKVNLNYPEEYLLAMCGSYGPILGIIGPVCVRTLTFVTNLRSYGPFGVEGGHSFTFQMVGGQILGFYGRHGRYLDSIGAYVKQFCHPIGASVIEGNIAEKYDVLIIKQPPHKKPIENREEGSPKSVRVSKQSLDSKSNDKDHKQKKPAAIGGLVSYGPWGGNSGTVFDDGNSYTGVKQIEISRSMGFIVGIIVLYDKAGKSVWGTKHGGATADGYIDKIVLDHPREILVRISGYYCPHVITSLTFHTTKGVYGPYGEQSGVPFASNSKDGAIVGIHGRTKGVFLNAIGVHFISNKEV